MRPWAPLLLVARGALVGGDFVFVDFNETQGLRLNGDAETSACAAEAGRAHAGAAARRAAYKLSTPPAVAAAQDENEPLRKFARAVHLVAQRDKTGAAVEALIGRFKSAIVGTCPKGELELGDVKVVSPYVPLPSTLDPPPNDRHRDSLHRPIRR